MPKLADRQAIQIVKMLNLGSSGTGKTAALLALAKAGYNVRIADFDNGVDILGDLARHEKDSAAILDRIHYLPFTDEMKTTKGGEIIPKGPPKAYSNFVKSMNEWKDDDNNLGSIETWTSSDVFVIDSLTFLSNAVMRWHLFNVGRISQPYQSDWLVAQRKVTQLLELLYSNSLNCNIVINAHIRYMEVMQDVQEGFPESIGKALPPQIPRYFNTVVQTKIMGAGANAKRKIRVVPDTQIGLKNAAPHALSNSELSLETGLADIFKAIRGTQPKE